MVAAIRICELDLERAIIGEFYREEKVSPGASLSLPNVALG